MERHSTPTHLEYPLFCHCERSEAISFLWLHGEGDCFVAEPVLSDSEVLLAMTLSVLSILESEMKGQSYGI